MDRKLIVISIDSMVKEDLEIIKKLPNMGKLLEKSSVILENEATYPTLTHSIHTSIATGCYPGKHGVIGNEHFVPGDFSAPWYEKREEVQVKSVLDYAKEQGMTTAAVMYPLTLEGDYDWILHRAEFHAKREEEIQWLRNRCRPEGLFDEIAQKRDFSSIFEIEHKQRRADALCFQTAEYLIDQYQPDVMYIHVVLIDSTRHKNGVFSPKIEEAYRFLDQGFGMMMDALEKKGLTEKTIFCVTADHGHLDIKRVVSVNRFFMDEGYITVNEQNQLVDWKAYLHSNSLSAYIYIKDHDEKVKEAVKSLLWENREKLCIEKIYTKDEVKQKYHLDGSFDLVIESTGEASYSSDYFAPLYKECTDADYRYSIATHGHEPHKGVQPTCFIFNPFAEKCVVIERAKIVDQAPTLAHMIGIEMKDTDGVKLEI